MTNSGLCLYSSEAPHVCHAQTCPLPKQLLSHYGFHQRQRGGGVTWLMCMNKAHLYGGFTAVQTRHCVVVEAHCCVDTGSEMSLDEHYVAVDMIQWQDVSIQRCWSTAYKMSKQ